ncbi:hypothetical protein TNCV_4678341 [Trichonephila clavipes]|nr:hypothetical protein TNCV_4678341 [Trichonephila clavipes]
MVSGCLWNFPRLGMSLTVRGYPSADSRPMRDNDSVTVKNPLQNTGANCRQIKTRCTLIRRSLTPTHFLTLTWSDTSLPISGLRAAP